MRNVALGRRVLIRRPMAVDGRQVIEMNRRSKKLHRPWMYPPTDQTSWKSYIRRLKGDQHDGFLVCLGDTDAILGIINISEIVRGVFKSAYLGYYAGEEYAIRGYMTEGLGLVLGIAFNRLRLHRLEANIL